jgi:hypothetical protein
VDEFSAMTLLFSPSAGGNDAKWTYRCFSCPVVEVGVVTNINESTADALIKYV